MDQKEKVVYEAPSVLVVEVKTEGVICASGERPDYDSEEW